MHVWIVEIGEPLVGIDLNARDWRCGMLAKALLSKGDTVTWWTSTFNHLTKRQRFDSSRIIEVLPGLQVRLLYGPGYSQNGDFRRFIHHHVVSKAFELEAASCAKPDVVFCCLPTLELAESSTIYGRANNVPVLIDIRDLWPDHYLTLGPKSMRHILKLAFFTEFRRAKRLLRNATGISAISTTFLNWALNNAGRGRGETDAVFPMGYPVLPNSSMDHVLSLQAELTSLYDFRPDDFLVTFVGTFVSSFDLMTVIDVARLLECAGNKRVRFVFAGGGGDEFVVRAHAEGLQNVLFTGWLDQFSIAAILGLSSIGFHSLSV